MARLLTPTALFCLAIATAQADEPHAWLSVATMPASEANQAAAADERYVYAIGNAVIGKYDRATGRRIAVSTGKATHLNSGCLWQGKLYCAHSNYPQLPARSEIMVLDSESMLLSTFKEFGAYRGSLTWVVPHSDGWWCNFAHYGPDNASTTLVKLDSQWRELGAWTYPREVIAELGAYSISGGVWLGDRLLATGHDKRRIYCLKLPKSGIILELVEAAEAPFPGQGIAIDPIGNGLIGIERAKRQVVFARLDASKASRD